MKPDALRMLGWVIPMLCMALAGWMLFKLNQDFTASSDATKQAHREIENVTQEFNKIKNLPPENRYAAVDDNTLEETDFLNYLRTSFQADGVTLQSWSSVSIEFGKDKLSEKLDDKVASLLKGIRRISSTLTLQGPYSNIRKLLGEMELSNRLFVLTNLTWNAAKEGTTLTMTLSRYVAPPSPIKAEKPKPKIEIKTEPKAKTPTQGITTTP